MVDTDSLPIEQLNEKLARLTFAEIDTSQQDTTLTIADAPDMPGAIVTLDVSTTLPTDVSEAPRDQYDYGQALVGGFVGVLLFVILLLLLFLLRNSQWLLE